MFVVHYAEAEMIEDLSYKAIKEIMVLEGHSESRAECLVTTLKYLGVTNDVTDIRNTINYDKLMDKLNIKAEIADFVCSPSGIFVAILVALFVLSVLCVCIKRCCCTKSHKPAVIHLTPSTAQLIPKNGMELPYSRLDIN